MAQQGCKTENRETMLSKDPLRGFTLIELLVVIAIIALLLSISLPGLRRAKQAAQSVVCRSHLRGAGMGVTTYTVNWDNWLPGPNTSGLRAAKGILPSVPTDPVQNVDWISPTMGDDLGFVAEKVPRLQSMFNTDLRCPANKVKYDYAYPGSIAGLDPQSLNYSSYSAAIVHHMLPLNGQTKGYVTDAEIRSMFRVGNGYRPKLDQVGMPGRKVWAMDGARYYHPVNGTSFNDLSYQNDGGNFMITGPVFPRGGDPFLIDRPDLTNPNSWTLTEVAERLAYRHNKRINVVFMDGHCETLDMIESLKPTYYFPKGTYITPLGAASLQAPDVGSGYIR